MLFYSPEIHLYCASIIMSQYPDMSCVKETFSLCVFPPFLYLLILIEGEKNLGTHLQRSFSALQTMNSQIALPIRDVGDSEAQWS